MMSNKLYCWNRALLAVVLALILLPDCSLSASNGRTEDEIKAAFLFAFTKYVEWPAATLNESTSAINIGVYGDPKFAEIIRRTVEGKTSQNKPIKVISLDRLEITSDLHIFYSGTCHGEFCDRIIDLTTNLPVLTICVSEDFAEEGGDISFYIEANKVRFAINQQAAERKGLKLSSKLLRLAKVVGND